MRALATYKRDCETSDDIKLALLELAALSGSNPHSMTLEEGASFLAIANAPNVLRDRTVYGFEFDGKRLPSLTRRLAFWDYIVVRDDSVTARRKSTTQSFTVDGGLRLFVTQSQLLEWTAYVKNGQQLTGILRNGHPAADLMALGDPIVAVASASNGISLSPAMRRKNEYLSHGFHKYKAKFFPRLARSLINYTVATDRGTVLDPFCGSGTTGVEASLLGLRAIQFDIDPLSVFISRAKARLDMMDSQRIAQIVARHSRKSSDTEPGLFSGARYRLPEFLLARRPKRLTPEQMTSIENEVTALKEVIEHSDGVVRDLLLVTLSHAIATKVSLRWMGTGDNRYALEIAARPTQQIFKSQLAFLLDKLQTLDDLRSANFIGDLGTVDCAISDCSRLPLAENAVDSVVTSPPYLPAASGRETYLRSRAASLMALGLMTEKDILETEKAIVGSILASPSSKPLVPKSVNELADWMQPQRERTAKARPTVAYFEKLALSLREMQRTLKPGGKAALVVSKEHTFWEMTSKKVLRKFDMVEPIIEMATKKKYGVGLEVDRVETIELSKMDFVARPGAQGNYSEAIIILKKRC